MTEPLYDLDAARVEEQRERMRRLQDAGICSFCPEHVADYAGNPIFHTGDHWYVTENAFPYAGTTAHFLIVARRHVRTFDELPDEAGAELWAIKRRLKEQTGARATGTVERSGEMALIGSSVAHLHVHFVVPAEAPEATVKFRMSARGSAGHDLA